jgi:hypothetical protein
LRTTRDTQLETIREMSKQCQLIVARHDDLLFKIKALAATLWTAASGWALSSESAELLLVALFSVCGLWFVAATFRAAQKRYIRRSDELFRFLLDANALESFLDMGRPPDAVPSSLGGYESLSERAWLVARGFVSPTVSVFYGFFVVMSVFLYAQVS